MNSTNEWMPRLSFWTLTVAGILAGGWPSVAQDFHHLSVIKPGGVPGMPVVTGIEQTTNGASVNWYGPSGYYRLFENTNLKNGSWQQVGAPNLTDQATVTNPPSTAFFRVSGPAPNYAGSQVCVQCHQAIHTTVMQTHHAEAFTNAQFVALGGQTNSACLVCHTVGYGLPTGFVSLSHPASVNDLSGVQCENCHGPAANHVVNPQDPTVRPHLEMAATVCGGCHNSRFVPTSVASLHRPYYENWHASAHHAVVPDVATEMAGSRGPTVFIPTCGRCHSGTVREALLEDFQLPDASQATAVGITCAVCHDPHQDHAHTNALYGVLTNPVTGATVTNLDLGPVYTNQLRYPYASLVDYHATGSFSTNYDPNINVCAQCHNDRGADYSDTSRPPHHSPQYNILLGTVGVLAPGVAPEGAATHALLEKQCVTCHMQTTTANGLPTATPSGHLFEVNSYRVCLRCHSNPQGLVVFVTTDISNQVQQVKGLLDQWATQWASLPANSAFQQYGPQGSGAWEYTYPGDLSPNLASGPPSDLQQSIPVEIRKARFDLYLVRNDGSYGVHNGPYEQALLDSAQTWIEQQIAIVQQETEQQ